MAEASNIEPGDRAVAISPVPSAKSSKRPWPMFLGLLIGVPLICYLMIEYIVMPKLIAAMQVSAATGAAAGSPSPENGASLTPAAGAKEQTVDFGKLMVNVAGSSDNRYLRINLVFASNNPELKEIIKTNDVALRDAAITVLSSQALSDLDKNDGRETTRRALISRVNGILGGPIITQIYFTEFVIQ